VFSEASIDKSLVVHEIDLKPRGMNLKEEYEKRIV